MLSFRYVTMNQICAKMVGIQVDHKIYKNPIPLEQILPNVLAGKVFSGFS
jgi:hypothetical protein